MFKYFQYVLFHKIDDEKFYFILNFMHVLGGTNDKNFSIYFLSLAHPRFRFPSSKGSRIKDVG